MADTTVSLDTSSHLRTFSVTSSTSVRVDDQALATRIKIMDPTISPKDLKAIADHALSAGKKVVFDVSQLAIFPIEILPAILSIKRGPSHAPPHACTDVELEIGKHHAAKVETLKLKKISPPITITEAKECSVETITHMSQSNQPWCSKLRAPLPARDSTQDDDSSGFQRSPLEHADIKRVIQDAVAEILPAPLIFCSDDSRELLLKYMRELPTDQACRLNLSSVFQNDMRTWCNVLSDIITSRHRQGAKHIEILLPEGTLSTVARGLRSLPAESFSLREN